MISEQELANMVYGKQEKRPVGRRAKMEYLIKELAKLGIIVFVVMLLHGFGLQIEDNGRRLGREETLREVSRIADNPALLRNYLSEHGH